MKIYTVSSLLQNYRHSKIPVACILQLLLPYILWQFHHLLWEGMSDLAAVICQWYKVPIFFFTWVFCLYIYLFIYLTLEAQYFCLIQDWNSIADYFFFPFRQGQMVPSQVSFPRAERCFLLNMQQNAVVYGWGE